VSFNLGTDGQQGCHLASCKAK